MQEVIQQVGDLIVSCLPTLILFIGLVLAYQFLVQGPLSRTLALRRGKTSGAMENADHAIAAAQSKTDEYSEKLRHARAEIFRTREQRLQQWARERDTQLDAARKKAQQHVLEARLALDAEAESSRTTLMASADQLAEQVVRAVMPATAGGTR